MHAAAAGRLPALRAGHGCPAERSARKGRQLRIIRRRLGQQGADPSEDRRSKREPSVQEAQEYMAVPTREREENYYGAFGSYIITPDIFRRLDEAVRQNLVNRKGEVELTDALAWAASGDGLMGFVPDGESFDLGNAEAYRYTVEKFGETEQRLRH